MRDLEVQSTVIRLYEKSRFPSDMLRFDDIVNKITEHFAFQKLYTPADRHQQDQPVVLFFEEGYWSNIRIIEISMQSRKVTTRVIGDAEQCKSVADDLENITAELCNPGLELRRVVETHESKITCELDIDFNAVFHERIQKDTIGFMKANSEHIDSVLPYALTFRAHFTTPIDIQKHQVQLSPKSITLTRKSDAIDDEKIYESVMPVESNLHKEFLEKLEQNLRAID